MEKPFTHLPMLCLSLVSNERHVHASHSSSRFIFISVAAVWCVPCGLSMAHFLTSKQKPFEPVLARWSMSEQQPRFCDRSATKIFYFCFTFGGKSQTLFEWKRAAISIYCARSLRHGKENTKQVKFSLNILHGAVDLKMWMNSDKKK